MQKYMPFIREKKEIINAYQAMSSETRSNFERWSTLEFIYTSNYLEGSTLSRAENTHVVEKGLTVGGKTLAEHNNAVALARAVEWLRNSAGRSRRDIDEHVLINMHHLPSADEEGSFVQYSYQVPYVLTEFSEWLHQQTGSDVEVAVAAHIRLLQIKPFKDDNPKTARLLMNLLLLQTGYPLVLIQEKLAEKCLAMVKLVMAGGDSEVGAVAELSDLLYQSILYSLEGYVEAVERKGEFSVDRLLKIGQLAKLTNETIPTIRHWTKQGLLQVAGHSPGGYQLYEPTAAEEVVKIRELQRGERRTVAEIQHILTHSA